MAKIVYKGNTILDIDKLVSSTGVKRIEVVTEYPSTEEEGVLYIKVEK